MKPSGDRHPAAMPSIAQPSARHVQVTIPADPPQLTPGLARALMKVLVASRCTSEGRARDQHAFAVDQDTSLSDECQTGVVVS